MSGGIFDDGGAAARRYTMLFRFRPWLSAAIQDGELDLDPIMLGLYV